MVNDFKRNATYLVSGFWCFKLASNSITVQLRAHKAFAKITHYLGDHKPSKDAREIFMIVCKSFGWPPTAN
jgi:hypothetical protein